MNLSKNVETELAACLEQIERGASPGESRQPVTADIVDLLQLAHQLGGMPPIKPDTRWLDASKQRLMARFGALHGREAESPRGAQEWGAAGTHPLPGPTRV